jgi:hypothetical protein
MIVLLSPYLAIRVSRRRITDSELYQYNCLVHDFTEHEPVRLTSTHHVRQLFDLILSLLTPTMEACATYRIALPVPKSGTVIV